MARRPQPTLADYAVIGISPALIMFMIGSLVFFLVTVFYQSQFDSRLCFILAMFIMAAVSIARISIEQGREYAGLFALPLAAVTLFAMFRFVELSGAFARLSGFFNIGLIATIWFCADKLTWDCTVIDESQDLSGKGLLETVGLHDEQPAAETEATSDDPHDTPPEVTQGLWKKFIEHRRRPHAPGIWVIYFSIAALPIFGFGQVFLHDDVTRRWAFKLLVIYVAAALGLLMTTSFMGLRRYLRQRRLEMPQEMAGTWLGVGTAMIVALLLVCMIMPRRNAEYSISDLSFLNSPIDLPVSDWGVGNDGQQQDEAERKVKQDDADAQMEGKKGEGGQTKSKQSKSQSKGKDADGQSKGKQSPGKQSPGKQSPGKQSPGKQSKGKQSKGEKKGHSKDRSPRKSKNQDDAGEREPSESGQDQDATDDQDNTDQEQQDPAESEDPAEDAENSSSPSEQQNQANNSQKNSESKSKSKKSRTSSASKSRISPPKFLSQLSPTLDGILKAIYWLVAIVVVAYLVWKNWEQVRDAVRNFIKAMKDLWARLFGGRQIADEDVATEATEAVPDWRPFSDFSDPFVSGRADRSSTEELIGYTFEAFEAWGRENGCVRLVEQTPIEFAKAAIHANRELGKDTLRVAELYNWMAYGKSSIPDANREYLRRFWQELTACVVV